MADIRKTFNFRAGVQVDDDVFIVRGEQVGIGTTIPTQSLDVRGNAKVVGILTAQNTDFSAGISTFGDVKIGTGISISASSGIITATTFSGDGSLLQNVPTSAWTQYNQLDDNGLSVVSVAKSTGNVGIATTGASSNNDLQIGSDPQDGFSKGVGIGSDGNIYASGIITATTFRGTLVGTVATVTSTQGNFSDHVSVGNTVSIGGTVGLGSHVYFGDESRAFFGDSEDLKIYHSNSDNHSYIKESGSGDLLIQASQIKLQDASGNDYLRGFTGGAVYLHNAGNTKFETTNTGAVVTGIMTATTLSSGNLRITDDGASGPLVSIMADDGNPYALMIGNSSYSNTAPFGLNFYNNNSGEGYFRHIGNGAYKDYHFSLHDNSNNKLCIKFEGDDQSVELYGRGSKDLETTGTGVVVSGVCTATTFVGNVTGNVTGTASGNATISSNGDNRIITGGSGNALTGESELTYSTYLNLTRSNSDTNFGDNSAPGGVNGIFISNSQSTNGVFSAITLSANDANGTNQSGSLVAKSVSGGYVPEVHITQRTANNTNESNFKITNTRSVQLRHQGNTRLETTTEGVKLVELCLQEALLT